ALARLWHPEHVLPALRLFAHARERLADPRPRGGAVCPVRAGLAAGADAPDRHQLQLRAGESVLPRDADLVHDSPAPARPAARRAPARGYPTTPRRCRAD